MKGEVKRLWPISIGQMIESDKVDRSIVVHETFVSSTDHDRIVAELKEAHESTLAKCGNIIQCRHIIQETERLRNESAGRQAMNRRGEFSILDKVRSDFELIRAKEQIESLTAQLATANAIIEKLREQRNDWIREAIEDDPIVMDTEATIANYKETDDAEIEALKGGKP